jgi:hypothetical protein
MSDLSIPSGTGEQAMSETQDALPSGDIYLDPPTSTRTTTGHVVRAVEAPRPHLYEHGFAAGAQAQRDADVAAFDNYDDEMATPGGFLEIQPLITDSAQAFP